MKVLLIHRLPLASFASTLSEHVLAFPLYSNPDVTLLNVELGLPEKLSSRKFDVIVLHYSLFGTHPFRLSDRFLDFLLAQRKTLKVAFFQDEHQYCQERFDLINKFKIDLVYSLFTQENASRIYLQNTSCTSVHYTLPGYVSETLVQKSNCYITDKKQEKLMWDTGQELLVLYGQRLRKNQILERYLLKKPKTPV